MAEKLHDFEAEWIGETERAVLLRVAMGSGDDEDVWFPLSVLETNDDGSYTVPMDWAEEKGIL